MATTPQNIIDQALAKNRKNQPGVLASDAELFTTFKRIYPVFWTIGARVNRTFFGTTSTVAASSQTWARPSDAELIFRIELPDGSRVIVVDVDQQDADPEVPAVFEWGQVFNSAGNANDPTTESLTFYHSKIPETPATAATNLEALWPESFNELLVLEMALVLALKDERTAEVQMLRPDRDAWLARFIAHLEHATVGVVTSRDLNRTLAQSTLPLESLLAGGTALEL